MQPATRYDRFTSLLHWLIGAALLGEIVFGFLLDDIAPRGTPARAGVINLHKTIGIWLGLAIVLRLAWRLRQREPAWPASTPHWQRRAARLGHYAMYACMLVVPASGYVASNFGKYGVKLFGVALKPWGPDLPAVYDAFNLLHVGSSWLFSALIVGHVALAIKHALVDHERIFARISPWAPHPTTRVPI